jgi:hypothetical protein
LEVVAETGIIGLTIFLSLIWYAMRCAVIARRKFLEVAQSDYAHLTTGLAVAFISYLVSALFIHAAFPRYFYLLLGIMYSLPAVAEHVRQDVAAKGIKL